VHMLPSRDNAATINVPNALAAWSYSIVSVCQETKVMRREIESRQGPGYTYGGSFL
jgi:hypothetical protein